MGRIGEVICRTWQTASKMKQQRELFRGQSGNDNLRIRRYVAKYTINPALTHGVSHEIGSASARWPIWYLTAFFGINSLIIKGGFIAGALMEMETLNPNPRTKFLPRNVVLWAGY